MRKISLSLIGLFAISALFMVSSAIAAPMVGYTGNTTVSINTGGSIRLSWAVYAAGSTEVTGTGTGAAGVNDFTYLYTFDNFTGTSESVASWSIGIPATTMTGSGALAGTTPSTLTPGGVTANNTTTAGVTSLSVQYTPGTLAASGTSSFYWLSAANPSETTSGTIVALTGGAGGFSAAGIMRADATAPPPTVPGVPEPETWALLIMLSGFTMWWMRRRQDEDVVEESFTA